MPNGEVCCLLQICCPPEKARKALAEKFVAYSDVSNEDAAKCADWLFDNFDLVPKGSVDLAKIVDAGKHK